MSAVDYEFVYIIVGKDATSTTPCGDTNPFSVACPTAVATINRAYSSTVVPTGGTGPYTFSVVSGSLPTGLTLSRTTGDLTGTPRLLGTFTYTLQCRDSLGAIATQVCQIIVSGSSGRITAICSSSTVIAGHPYSGFIRASGGTSPYTFSITSGSLPPGFSLNASTGKITGTTSTTGLFTFRVHIADSSFSPKTADVTCALRVVASSAIGGPGETVQWRLHRLDVQVNRQEGT